MIASERKEFLVFARVGDKALYKQWYRPGQARNWDLQLSSYAKDESPFTDADLPLSVDHGTKWDSVLRYFHERPELLDQYHYVMFPDDDLLFRDGDIDRMFEICAQYRLAIAQPALDLESYLSHPIVLQCPQMRLRYVTFVEAMCPCIETAYLKTIMPLFEKRRTGWGADLIWALLMPDPVYRAAVIDEVPMTHTRPLYSSNLYKDMKQKGHDPRSEIKEVFADYRNPPEGMFVYGGIRMDGRRLRGTTTRLRNGLNLLRIAAHTRRPYPSFRAGSAMLVRSFTRPGYRPIQLLPAVVNPSPQH